MKKRNILLLLVAFVFRSPIAFAQKKDAKKNEGIITDKELTETGLDR